MIEVKKNIKNLLLIASIGFFGFFFNFYYGFKGLNLVDSFQTFDSGYRVLNGDIPFRDYYVRDGSLIDFIQAGIFKVFGVSWASYVAHSSIVNFLFVIAIFKFSKINNLNNIESAIYALIGGILLYPPAGTPQIDQHSLGLSFINFFFFLLIYKNKKFLKFLILVPIFFGLIVFIKPVPTFYFIIITVILSFFNNKELAKSRCYYLIIGSILFFLFLFLFCKYFKIPIINIYEQFFNLAVQTGKQRINFDNLKDMLFSTLKIKYLILLILPYVSILMIIPKKQLMDSDIFLFISLLLLILFHESYTANQAVSLSFLAILSILLNKIIISKKLENNIIVKRVILILILIVTIRLARLDLYLFFIVTFSLFIFFIFVKKKENNNLILVYSIILTFFYFNKVIKDRFWHDITNPIWNKSYKAENIDKKLNGLIWLSNNQDTINEINDLKKNLEFLKKEKNNYLIITNIQLYNVLLERKNFSPVKYWWHNTSYPSIDNAIRDKFDNFFIEKIKINNIKKIIILDDITQKHTGNFKIEEFKWLKNCTKKKDNIEVNAEIYEVYKKCSLN